MLLKEKPRHGYAIMDEIEERIGIRPSTGQIYPLLQEFEEKGLAKIETNEVHGRVRKVYSLTDDGNKMFSKMLNRFTSLISSILESQVVECAFCDCKIYNGGYEEEINGETMTFCCKNCARAYKEMNVSKTDG
ncbi:MAG: hypothetical protein GWO20_07925 [Candidatus Korarchaeota archaeon]|nr:hypothetical protein [Candidatus Korarchaeota archaeon]NIU83420.1 hypothetical protein [Candidatus Thorarchaeota archaeon]NIW13692.1 hypothetical protein [Candidatus Thorarchaeota archaeon]NIW51791.1 hypothetical protein [Candidatus Korarchaeota archaeon]